MIPVIVFDDHGDDGFKKQWRKLIGPLQKDNGVVLSELGTVGTVRDIVAKAKRFVCIIVHHSWLTKNTQASLVKVSLFVRQKGKIPFVLFVTTDGFARPEAGSLDHGVQKEVACLYSRVHFPNEENVGSRIARVVSDFVDRLLESIEHVAKGDGNTVTRLRRCLGVAERGVPSAHINPGEPDTPNALLSMEAGDGGEGQTGRRLLRSEDHCFRFWVLVHYVRITMKSEQAASPFRSVGLWRPVLEEFLRCTEADGLHNSRLLADKVTRAGKSESVSTLDVVLSLSREMREEEVVVLLEKVELELSNKACFA